MFLRPFRTQGQYFPLAKFFRNHATLRDRFNRTHTYLRVSLTERCNFRCVYCMPEDGVRLTESSQLLTKEEYMKIISFFVAEGVTKIRFTGGEPTIYPHLTELIAFTRNMAIENGTPLSIHLTTNGMALGSRNPARLEHLAEAGLNGLNISLDSLVPSRFEMLTRRQGHEHALRCMEHALSLGLQTKVNCVVMRGKNDDELVNFVDLSRDRAVDVRFIEFMPFDHNRWHKDTVVSFNEMKTRIEMERPDFHIVDGDEHRIARMYRVAGYKGRVGFISSITQAFCDGCTRIRVTADGKLKACLLDAREVDLKPALRGAYGVDEVSNLCSYSPAVALPTSLSSADATGSLEDLASTMHGESTLMLRSLVRGALSKKELRHADAEDMRGRVNRPMVMIGG